MSLRCPYCIVRHSDMKWTSLICRVLLVYVMYYNKIFKYKHFKNTEIFPAVYETMYSHLTMNIGTNVVSISKFKITMYKSQSLIKFGNIIIFYVSIVYLYKCHAFKTLFINSKKYIVHA